MLYKLKDLIILNEARPIEHKPGTVWSHHGDEGKYGAKYKNQVEYFHDIERAQSFAKTGSGYSTSNKKTSLPTDSESLGEPIKNLGGTTGVTLHDVDGNKFVHKPSRDYMGGRYQLEVEDAVDNIYRDMGTTVPDSKLYDDGGGVYKISEFIDGELLRDYVDDQDKFDHIKSQLQQGFVLDALLANWDVIGLEEDNIIVSKSGNVHRIDNGGSLSFRAQGAPKGDLFGDEVKEIDGFRNSNFKISKWYGDVTDEMIVGQVRDISDGKDNIINKLKKNNISDDVIETVKNRINYLEDRFLENKDVNTSDGNDRETRLKNINKKLGTSVSINQLNKSINNFNKLIEDNKFDVPNKKEWMGNPDDDVLPTKPGYKVVYQVTSDKNIQSIKKNGMLKKYIRGYDAPNDTFFATKSRTSYSTSKPLIAFQVPENKLKKSSDEWYTFTEEVPPEDILRSYSMLPLGGILKREDVAREGNFASEFYDIFIEELKYNDKNESQQYGIPKLRDLIKGK